MNTSPIRTSSTRAANVVDACAQSIGSPRDARWATGRNVKRAEAGGRFSVVEVWTLKARVNGKAVTVRTLCDRAEAESFVAAL